MAPATKKQKLSNGSVAVVEADNAHNEDAQELPTTTTAKPVKDDKAEQQRRSLFVRSLAPTTTSESLTSYSPSHILSSTQQR